VRILHLRVTHRLRIHVAGAKFLTRNRSRAAEVRVMHGQVHVRKSRTGAERSKTAAIEFTEARKPEAPTPSAPPRMKKVTRTKRKPADPAPAAEPNPESETTAEPEE